MSTFILKRKCFDSVLAIGDNIVKGSAAQKRDQSYYDSLGKELDATYGKTSTQQIAKQNQGIKIGSDAGTRTKGGQTVYNKTAPKVTKQQIAQAGFKRGQSSVGIKQGAINTWNRMGKAGKAGTIIGGTVAAGLMAKGLFGGKKKENQ